MTTETGMTHEQFIGGLASMGYSEARGRELTLEAAKTGVFDKKAFDALPNADFAHYGRCAAITLLGDMARSGDDEAYFAQSRLISSRLVGL